MIVILSVTSPLLLIGGVPGTGKTTFAQWLADRGWTAVDHDEVVGHGFTRTELDAAWAGLFNRHPATVYPFVKFARQWPTSVVVEFGLPARWWRIVVQLRAAGVIPWWFDGDRDA